MTQSEYRTIAEPAEALYKEKGSRFLAFAYPVSDEEDIRQRLAELRKHYYDARHHCYAWMLGPDKSRFRANDDGEPNHSAGDPILGQIKSKDITNVLIVVVRYFGGTKLGVGGLIAAYRTAAEEALKNAQIIQKKVMCRVEIRFPYASTTDAMRLVKEFDMQIMQQQFDETCLLFCELALRNQPAFVEKIKLLAQLQSSIQAKVDGETI